MHRSKGINLLLPSILIALVILLGLSFARNEGTTFLRASHQWPGGIGDIRDVMIQMIADEVNDANVGLDLRVYPAQSLFRATDQWSALVRGRVDMIALPLDYASGRHPEFNATLMPGLVKNHAHARRISDSEFMTRIHNVIEEAGAVVLADAWLAGGFTSNAGCILEPEDIEGQVIRAAGPAFERMLVGAGASISSMPSSEIYTAMQTGVLDAANTSSASFMSYRIFEQSTCMTSPGDNALWFMYEPVMLSRFTWDRLTEEQQQVLRVAAENAEEYFFEQASLLDLEMERIFSDAGVEVVQMTAEQANRWRDIAFETSYEIFYDEVESGRELVRLALEVE
jgi:TRAP-type C4-dicarboxylate transport system substrate-binding protein